MAYKLLNLIVAILFFSVSGGLFLSTGDTFAGTLMFIAASLHMIVYGLNRGAK